MSSRYIKHIAPFCLLAAMIISSVPAQAATIGLIADGEDTGGTGAAMTNDINHLMTELPSGWSLDSVSWNGDIGYSGSVPYSIQAYENSTASSVPLFLAPGNHEVESETDMVALRNYFANYPSWNLSQYSGNNASTTNYAYDVGDVRVITVNQYTSTTSDRDTVLGPSGGFIHQSVFDWVKSEIKKTNKKHIAIMAHEPAYAQGQHIGDSLDANDSNRDKFVNLLASYGPIHHFVGHTHRSNLYEMSYENDNNRESVLGGGLWELDGGAFGTKASGGSYDSFPSVGYFHTNSDTFGDYEIRLVQGKGTTDWASPVVSSKTYGDLDKVILLNTWDGAGTGTTTNGLYDMKYFVDYTSTVASNPDWSANNSGKWWEPAFDEDTAGWTGGELSVGYKTGTPKPGWINTTIDAFQGQVDEQVHSIMGRVEFPATSTASYNSMTLDLDYDDGVMVWLNGTLIYNGTSALMTAPTTGDSSEYFDKLQSDTTHAAAGESASIPTYTSIDVSSFKSALVDGNNVLTYWNINSTTGSSDLMAAVRLSMSKNVPDTTLRYNLREGENSYTGMIDTYLNASSSATNYGTVSPLLADGDAPDAGMLLKWDLSSLPTNINILTAKLVYNVTNTTSNSYNLYELIRSWTETGANWNTTNGTTVWGTAGARNTTSDYVNTSLATLTGSGLGRVTVDLNTSGVQLINDWLQGVKTNNGFIIQNYTATDGLQISSSEDATLGSRPQLALTYETIAPDTTAPTVSAIASTSTQTGATITFTTDESAFNRVVYGETTSYASSTVTSATRQTSHTVTLSGLTASTTYNFAVEVTDASGNQATSTNYTFTTLEPDTVAPTISNVSSAGVTDSQATVTFSTDESAFNQVVYGVTSGYGSSTSVSSNASTSHSITLTGLTASTTYNYAVVATDAAGNQATSSNYTFTTGSPSTAVTVVLQEGANSYVGMTDTHIVATAATTNYAAATTLVTDGDPDTGLLAKWTLSSIPSGSTITAAYLVYNVENVSLNDYEIYQIKQAWTESGATWQKWTSGNNTKNWATAGALGTADVDSTVRGTLSGTSLGTATSTLNSSGVALIQGWVNGTIANNGFIIRDYTGTDSLQLSSSEATTVANRPKLVIVYEPSNTSSSAEAPISGGGKKNR